MSDNAILNEYGGLRRDQWEQIWLSPDVPRMCPRPISDRFIIENEVGRTVKPRVDLSVLPTLAEWTAFYEDQHSLVSEDPVLKQKRAIEEFGAAQFNWSAEIFATDWGSDPLWHVPASYLEESACWYDPIRKIVRYPRQELIDKYGTASLTEYATKMGMPPPVLQL